MNSFGVDLEIMEATRPKAHRAIKLRFRLPLTSPYQLEAATMRTSALSVAAGAALAACALDSAAAFHVSGKAPLALATGRAGSARAVKPAGPMMKGLTLNGKKLSKFEAMRFKAGR